MIEHRFLTCCWRKRSRMHAAAAAAGVEQSMYTRQAVQADKNTNQRIRAEKAGKLGKKALGSSGQKAMAGEWQHPAFIKQYRRGI